MTTLLIGGTTDSGIEVQREMSARGHEVTVCTAVEDGKEYISEVSPALTFICGVTEETLDLCRSIRADQSIATAVVFLDSNQDERLLQAAVDAGADDFVVRGTDNQWSARAILWERKYGIGETAGDPPGPTVRQVATDGEEFQDLSSTARMEGASRPSAKASLERRLQQQRQLAQLGVAALKEPNELALMGEITEYARKMLNVDAATVFEPVAADKFALKAGVGWERGLIGHATIPDGDEEQVGYTQRSRSPIVVDDFQSDDRFTRSSLLERADISSSLTVPIEGREHPYGVLGVFSRSVRRFDKHDVHLLQLMANMLGERIEQRRVEQELRNSEMRAKAVLDTTVDAIITIDERGQIESFNKAAENIFGYAAEEVIGKNVRILMPSPWQEEHDGYIQNYLDTGEPKIIGIGREVQGQRKDGSTFPLQLAVSEVQLEDERLFTGIIRDLSEKKRLEREILRVSEQERRRIGQDLHDGLGQMLNAIAFFSETLTEQLEREDERLAERAEFITEKIREADEQARSLSRGLVMVNTDKDGLYGALKRLCTNAEELYGVDCYLNRKGQPEVEDATVGTHLYRIAQEAISNAVRHGDASKLVITLASGAEYLRLRIRDDGIGFPEEPDEENQGMGVQTMRYRAHLIGGSLHIQSDPAGGTTVTCTRPLEEHKRITVE